MGKKEKLQEFSSLDAASLFVLLISTLVIVWSIVAHGLTAKRRTQARIDCDTIAISVLNTSNRVPASKTSISAKEYQNKTDPWGHRYRYRVLTNSSNHREVAVYSAGPNGRFDTTDRDFKVDKYGRVSNVNFRGDDIGTVQKAWP